MNVIEAKKLTKSFRKHQVVKGIDLIVKQGEIFGFLGRNGAGKTTFINILTGISLPTSGEFSILGKTHTQLDKVKKKIGVLPDYSDFYRDDSALDHLRFFASVKGLKVSKAECLEALQAVGILDFSHTKVKKFSFGMKKKLGIAQAILLNPPLVFLDEPTSGLDPESAIEIQSLIRSLAIEKKMTIFMTSHNLHEVEKLCTKIAIMKNGKIDSIGTMEELREQYDSALEITMKISADRKNFQTLFPELEQVCKIVEWNHEILKIEVVEEKSVAAAIHLLSSNNIDIFRVESNQVSLEEIFLND